MNVVSRNEWLAARKSLLAKEKEFSKARDALAAERRELPAVKVEVAYTFEETSGKRSLLDLFGDKKQLVVYHLMFDPSWDVACKSCSLIADHFDGMLPHLAARHTAFCAISRAPLAKIQPFQKRMRWKFRWLSSHDTTFNADFGVSPPGNGAGYNYDGGTGPKGESPGLSTFLRQGNDVLHTYSTYGRGLDLLINAYNYLDLTPLGRQEEGLKFTMEWVRHHDKY
jgi:predicted dithiol-disulfide oxidoreductase (DUF899 family)